MTLTEFLYKVRDKSWSEKVLATFYFTKRYRSKESLTVEDLRKIMKHARVSRVAKANLADVLAKSAPHVETVGKKGIAFLWRITDSGEERIRAIMGLPEHDVEVEHDVATLELLLKNIGNHLAKDYVEESLICLKVGALRASIVFLWSGAVTLIQSEIIKCPKKKLNLALKKFDRNARTINNIEDLYYIKERNLLLVAQELGYYDRNEREILEDTLKLRNKCGHPGNYRPGIKKASGFIEDLMSIVFL